MTRIVMALALAIVSLDVSGCARARTNRILDRGRGDRRIEDIVAIEGSNLSVEEIDALLNCLDDDEPAAISWFAIRAIGESHLWSRALETRWPVVARRIVPLLGDDRRGDYGCYGSAGLRRTPTVRSEALHTLVAITSLDYGYDADAWTRALDAHDQKLARERREGPE